MRNITLSNGRLIDPAQNIDQVMDIHIADGAVVALGKAPAGFKAERVIDASGQIVCPGLVDLRARLREPGLEHKGTIATETVAAASAGITTLVCPPDTDPVIDTPAVAELIHQRADYEGKARVVTLAALTKGLKGEELSEMHALKANGCVGVSNGNKPVVNSLVLRRAMEYAATFDLTVFLYPEDPWLANKGCAHEGSISLRMGLPGIPESAETVAVARDLMLIEQTGVKAHFCGISCGRSLEMIQRAREQGLPVTVDVAVHQLHMTDMDITDFNTLCHVRPPLRSQRDREALRAGIASGAISAICSDHQPHDADAKLAPFADTEPGISGLETLLSLVLRLVDEGLIDMRRAIELLTAQPAAIANINAGRLAPGDRADLCVFDPKTHWTPAREKMHSRGRNTPFAGWDLTGQVNYTLLNGRLVYDREIMEGNL